MVAGHAWHMVAARWPVTGGTYMDENKQRQEASLIGRFLSMECLLVVMGTASLVYGLSRGIWENTATGLAILAMLLLLMLLRHRKKDRKNR